MRLFLQALTALAPSKSVSPNEQEMNEIVRLLNGAADSIPLMKRTICLGTQPDPNGKLRLFKFVFLSNYSTGTKKRIIDME